MNLKTYKKAKQLFDSTSHDVLFVNPKGEFFSKKNYCDNSLEKGEVTRTLTKAGIDELIKKAEEVKEIEKKAKEEAKAKKAEAEKKAKEEAETKKAEAEKNTKQTKK